MGPGVVRLLANPAAHNTVYNVGNPDEITVRELAERIIELAGSNSTIEYVPHEVDFGSSYEDIPRRVPNIDRIHQAIGWTPTTPFDLGLTRSLVYRTEEFGLVNEAAGRI